MTSACAPCQNGPFAKTVSHHVRQRATVRRLMPNRSKSAGSKSVTRRVAVKQPPRAGNGSLRSPTNNVHVYRSALLNHLIGTSAEEERARQIEGQASPERRRSRS